jgi:hypothetical protein
MIQFWLEEMDACSSPGSLLDGSMLVPTVTALSAKSTLLKIFKITAVATGARAYVCANRFVFGKRVPQPTERLQLRVPR